MYQSLFNSILATAAAGASTIKDATATPGDNPAAMPANEDGPINQTAPESAVTPGNSERADKQAFEAMKEKVEQYQRQEQTRKERLEHLKYLMVMGGEEDE